MSETFPAYVGSGIDWAAKMQADRATEESELALQGRRKKMQMDQEREDFLRAMASLPQFAFPSGQPVDVGQFSPTGGPIGEAPFVGVGPRGAGQPAAMPFSQVQNVVPSPEQQQRADWAKRTLLGVPEPPFEAEARAERKEETRARLTAEEKRKQEAAREDLEFQKEIFKAAQEAEKATASEKRAELSHVSQQTIRSRADLNSALRQLALKRATILSNPALAIDPKMLQAALGEIDAAITAAKRQHAAEMEDLQMREFGLRDPKGYAKFMVEKRKTIQRIKERILKLPPEAQTVFGMSGGPR